MHVKENHFVEMRLSDPSLAVLLYLLDHRDRTMEILVMSP